MLDTGAVNSGGGLVGSFVFGTIVYYTGQPLQFATVMTAERFGSPNPTDPSQPGTCVSANSLGLASQSLWVGPATTFDLSTLGLVPPFILVQQ